MATMITTKLSLPLPLFHILWTSTCLHALSQGHNHPSDTCYSEVSLTAYLLARLVLEGCWEDIVGGGYSRMGHYSRGINRVINYTGFVPVFYRKGIWMDMST